MLSNIAHLWNYNAWKACYIGKHLTKKSEPPTFLQKTPLKVNCQFKSLYLKKNLPIARWNIAMGPWGGCHENEFGDDDKDDNDNKNDNDSDNEVCLCFPTTQFLAKLLKLLVWVDFFSNLGTA